ncbi:MAG: hypothetical protein K0R54_6067 [Clostridiaceae bacterium]|nr:hypothetical protein [Clostridiaceae bacterium]
MNTIQVFLTHTQLYFKNGKMKAEGTFLNNQMEGEWRFYRESGQLCQIGNFQQGKKHGAMSNRKFSAGQKTRHMDKV